MNNYPSNTDGAPSQDSVNQLIRSSERLKEALAKQFRGAGETLSRLYSLSSGISLLVSRTGDSIAELKEVDALLTRMSRTGAGLSKDELEKLGSASFSAASKYGKKASDYLAAVQKASRTGYKDAAAIAELSLSLQSTGNMTGELAERYILAADEAYGLNGSVLKLTRILDGSAHIADSNAVSMEELARGMSSAASGAQALGVGADQTAAALGAMLAGTRLDGDSLARAFHTILLNIRQVADGEAGVSPDGIAAYEDACLSLNVSLKETRNGIDSLREPMEVIEELAAQYSGLSLGDLRKSSLLDAVGGGENAAALDALLSNYGLYEKMLQDYASSAGSLAAAAQQTTASWEGSLNRLANTWTDTIGNIVDPQTAVTAIDALNGLLSVINNITGALGPLATLGVGAGLFAGIKNAGKRRMSVRIS